MTFVTDESLGVHLTVRELEVLMLVAEGLSAKAIAKHIEIAPRTVERHIDNARLKMRARNRAHLVTRAVACGLLDTPDQRENTFLPALESADLLSSAEELLLL